MPDDLRRIYLQRVPLLQQVADSLAQETQDALQETPHIDRIAFRVKAVNSFLAKAGDPKNQPTYADPLVEIEDQIAGRVIVFHLDDIGTVLDMLKGTFNTVERSQRQPDRDAEFGYESSHLIATLPPHVVPDAWSAREDMPTTFELQVRTIFMHAYAEPQHDLAYKALHDLPREIRRELAWIAASAWGADQAYERIARWAAKKAEEKRS
jgi:GTP pyrophosphokinase